MLDAEHFERLTLLQAQLALTDWIATLRKHAPTSPWLEAFEVSHREIADSVEHLRQAAGPDGPAPANDVQEITFMKWTDLAPHERQRRVLEAFGPDDRLTTAQVVERVFGWQCYRERIAAVLTQLMATGDVRRAEIEGYRGGPHPRWRYFRNVELSGPIAELEQAFHDEPREAT